jgi:hypothetical protein
VVLLPYTQHNKAMTHFKSIYRKIGAVCYIRIPYALFLTSSLHIPLTAMFRFCFQIILLPVGSKNAAFWDVFTAATMTSSGILHRVTQVTTDVSENILPLSSRSGTPQLISLSIYIPLWGGANQQ